MLEGLRFVLAPALSTVTLIVCTRALGVPFSNPYVALAIVNALLCALFLGRYPSSRNSFFPSGLTIVSQTGLAWLAVAASLLLIAYVTKTSDFFSRRAILIWFVVTFPVLVSAFLGQRFLLRMALMSSANTRRAVIAGINPMSSELAMKLRQRPELGLTLCGFFDDRSEKLAGKSVAGSEPGEILGDLDGVRSFVNRRHIEVVFVALPYQLRRTRKLLDELRDTTASVYLIPDLSIFDVIQSRSDEIQGVPVIALCESPLQGMNGAVKRLTDIVVATMLLLALSPVMLLCSLAIMLDSRGPVIFRQIRYGLDGERIRIYKFRTMTVCENGAHVPQAKADDPRITRVGRILRRTSLDELPQLINVVQGRMSLVGPRPHAVAHNEQYRRLIDGYMVRHKVAPGITGLAQVNGCRGETASLEDMARRVRYDLDYLRRWCWLLDIKILLKTVIVVLRRDNAY